MTTSSRFFEGKETCRGMVSLTSFLKKANFFPYGSYLRVKDELRNECKVFSSMGILRYYSRNIHTASNILFHVFFKISLKFLFGDKEISEIFEVP